MTGDPKLAKMMREHDPGAPVEKIMLEDWLATTINYKKLKRGERVVQLACGHWTVTAAVNRCSCHECHKMILNGEDYDLFRNHRE